MATPDTTVLDALFDAGCSPATNALIRRLRDDRLDHELAVPLIARRPVLSPDYIVVAESMRSVEAFVEINASELNRYYDQLRAEDPEDCCGREEFYRTQYDVQRAYWDKWSLDARNEPRAPRYSNIEPNTGLRRHGEN